MESINCAPRPMCHRKEGRKKPPSKDHHRDTSSPALRWRNQLYPSVYRGEVHSLRVGEESNPPTPGFTFHSSFCYGRFFCDMESLHQFFFVFDGDPLLLHNEPIIDLDYHSNSKPGWKAIRPRCMRFIEHSLSERQCMYVRTGKPIRLRMLHKKTSTLKPTINGMWSIVWNSAFLAIDFCSLGLS